MVLCRITRARVDVMLEQCRSMVSYIIWTTDDASARSSSFTSNDIDWLHGGGLKLTLWIAKIPLPAHNFLFVERLSNFLPLVPQIQSRAPLQSLTTSLRPHRSRFHHPLFCCSACSGRSKTTRRNFLLPEFPKEEASYRRSDENTAAKVSKVLSMGQPQTPPQTSSAQDHHLR